MLSVWIEYAQENGNSNASIIDSVDEELVQFKY